MSTTTTMRLGASIVIAMASIGFAVVPGEYAQATKTDRGQNTTHLVFCQKTGNHWTITKGDNPSDNKNRFQVGTWNEHERGEGWNQARAEQEFLSKCSTTEPATPVTPPATTPGNSNPKPTTPAPNKGQSTTHLVFCQKTGNHWTITKGDNPSDNKNRFQVGTWNEHERGEGWNQARANKEFLDKCEKPSTPVEDDKPAPTPDPDKPGMGGIGPVSPDTTAPTEPEDSSEPSVEVTELPRTGTNYASLVAVLGTAVAAYGAAYALQAKRQ